MKKTNIKAAGGKASVKPSKPVSRTVKKPAASAKTAPAVKAKPGKSLTTIITANVNVGFGNMLYLRGNGAGLSWDEGLSLECVKDDYWTITLSETTGLITYKLLINDQVWSIGENYTTSPGRDTVVKPVF